MAKSEPAKKKEEKDEGPPPPSADALKKAASQPPDDYAAKLDMCLTDGVVKSGAGVILGAVTSALFFRRRRWPVIAGLGVGIGIAWANCEHAINPPKQQAKA